MVAVSPVGVKAQGNIKLSWVPAFVSYLAPKLTELNAAGSLDLSCFMASDGWNPSIETAKGTSTRRLCTRQQYEQFGQTTSSLGDLSYIVDPQGAALSNGQLAWEKLVPFTSGYFTVRMGTDATTVDYAVGQWFEVWPVTLGTRLIQGDPSDEFAEFLVSQSVIVTGATVSRVALVA
jgi:hypothetical protein